MNVKVGSKLKAGTGTWKFSPTSFTYQWERGDEWGSVLSWAPIEGATNAKYTVTEADKKHTLRCKVVAKNSEPGSEQAYSAPLVVADERTDFARTFSYSGKGTSGNDTVLAAYPAEAAGSPCAIFIHGGGFSSQPSTEEPAAGEKTEPEESEAVKKMTLRPEQANFRAKGWATFNMNYRQRSPSDFDEPMDIMRAVAWVQANAARFNGDGSKVCLIGGSSGATLALMAALRLNTLIPGSVKAVAALSPLASFEEYIAELLADKKVREEKAEPLAPLESHFQNIAWCFAETQAHLETVGYLAAHTALKERMEKSSPRKLVDSNAPFTRVFLSELEYPTGPPTAQPPLLVAAYEAAGVGARITSTLRAGESQHAFGYWNVADKVKDTVDTYLKAHV